LKVFSIAIYSEVSIVSDRIQSFIVCALFCESLLESAYDHTHILLLKTLFRFAKKKKSPGFSLIKFLKSFNKSSFNKIYHRFCTHRPFFYCWKLVLRLVILLCGKGESNCGNSLKDPATSKTRYLLEV